NVLLASLLGGRARLVMNNPQIEELLTPQVTFAEVQEYAPVLARRKRLTEDILLLALASLSVILIEPEAYQRSLSEAKRRIAGPVLVARDAVCVCTFVDKDRWHSHTSTSCRLSGACGADMVCLLCLVTDLHPPPVHPPPPPPAPPPRFHAKQIYPSLSISHI